MIANRVVLRRQRLHADERRLNRIAIPLNAQQGIAIAVEVRTLDDHAHTSCRSAVPLLLEPLGHEARARVDVDLARALT